MKWEGREGSSNIGISGGKAVGGGIGGIIIGLILWLVFGVNPMTAMQTGSAITNGSNSATTQPVDATKADRDTQFVSVVLRDTEVVWGQIFKEMGTTYKNPQLILFNGSVKSGCGTASAATGPFYCPADQKVYLDTSFFQEMRQKLGINGDQNAKQQNQGKAGEFAEAYVIAHEVGHHVQTLLGISQKVDAASRQASKAQANNLSVRQELQADCFAGVWANRNQQRVQFLEQGDIEVALDAANKIGDDRLAQASGRAVVPDSFTHGTSQQRMTWFTRGLKSGDIKQCDTFANGAL